MKIVYSGDFIRSAKVAPKPIRSKLVNLLGIFQGDPFHPKLHAKPLVGKLKGFYSFRVTRDWRVIFNFLNLETIFLVDITHRKDIYR